MFGGLFRVRLRAAEQALASGRLDDAYRMMSEAQLAAQPRGQKVVAGLAAAFLVRAREHYRADRFREALIDLNRAESCGCSPAESAELRRQVMTVADEVARQGAEKRQRIEEARRRVMSGSLAGGSQILKGLAADDPEVQRLDREIDERRDRIEKAMERAADLFKQKQFAAAMQRIAEVRRLSPFDERVIRLESQIAERIIANAREAFDRGRISQAAGELALLGDMSAHASIAELSELVAAGRNASAAIAQARYDDAMRWAKALERLAPKTPWVREAAAQLTRVNESILQLRSGPLGLDAGPQGAGLGTEDTVVIARRQPVAVPSTLPNRLLVLVDGGGSFLLIRGQRASIGRAASSNPADIPIFSDLSERHAEIARVEDDYFLFSSHNVEIGGRPSRQQLLRDGDRVVLARRAKFTFRLPNPKTASARLDLSDSTRTPQDVRTVVLFRQAVMFGASAHCHVSCSNVRRDWVLFERAGGLWIRPEGRGVDGATEVELGKPLDLDGSRITVKAWPSAAGDGRVLI